ncbi:aspartate carbamoyltransferase [Candidatus Woesearchaeota archaeon]|nr:aspartate carbamoyltransferase [Candidatus Woesearchaeota archaeon]MBW3017829.1 aspartate carbamoyltransferase [Candidatus Woesearchaeota archaeon]
MLRLKKKKEEDTKFKFKNRSIVSIEDLSREEIIHIIETAAKLEKQNRLGINRTLFKGKVLATLFFEVSTRTRLSFESAFEKMGGKIIGFADAGVSSTKKGESLKDTVNTVEQYADIIAMRHPLDGSARLAADSVKIPVINGGDGANQHPTQTLLDLYTIKKSQDHITDLKIALVGDLKYGRTVHSLATALSLFKCRLYLVSPPQLKMPNEYLKLLEERGVDYSEHEKVEEVIEVVDVLYMTRIQQERFADPIEYERVKGVYVIKKDMLKHAKPNLAVMHPLPRVNEISTDVDNTKHAIYFQQAANGVPVRQAVMALVLGLIK